MSRVLIASITQLCAADHRDNPAAIAAWTANKSAEGVGQMLDDPALTMLVAERDNAVVAVGAVSGDAVMLNYVDPAHRGTGVSRALLAAMEAALRVRGVTRATLKSTATARDFYRSQGWVEGEPAACGRFIDATTMHKLLG